MFAAVTGASSGIGLALAREFAENGFDLLIVSDTGEIEAAATELRQLGRTVQTLQADLTTDDGVNDFIAAMQQSQRLDAIAINAGVGVSGRFAETSLDDELRIVDLNCRSTVSIAKAAVRMMTSQGEGRILFTSSIAALMPGPFEAVYSASKAFVYSLSEALRNELKDSGVTVTALMPGPTDTDFFEAPGYADTKLGQEKKADPQEVAREGFRAMMSGKDRVTAGQLKTKVQAAIAGNIPPTIGAEMHRKEAEPGSGR